MALGLSQLALHLFLELAGSHQGEAHGAGSSFDPLTMVVAHLLAAVGAGLLLARVEAALFVLTSLWNRLVPLKVTPLPNVAPLRAVCTRPVTLRTRAQLVAQRIHTLRGPPTFAC